MSDEKLLKNAEEIKKIIKGISDFYTDPTAPEIKIDGKIVIVYVPESSSLEVQEDDNATEPKLEHKNGIVTVYVPKGTEVKEQKGGFWPFNTYKKIPMKLGDIESIKAQLQMLRADIEQAFKAGFFDKKLYKTLAGRADYSAKNIQKPQQLNEIALLIEDFIKALKARRTVLKDVGDYQSLLGKLDSLNIRIETAYKYKILDPKVGRAFQSRISDLRRDIKAKKPQVGPAVEALEKDVLQSISAKKDTKEFADSIKNFEAIKTIAADGATGLQATLIALYNAGVGVANDFMNTGKISRILLIIGFLTILISAFASYKFLDIFVTDYAITKLRNNPLNGETVDFKVAQASTGFSSSNKYPYKIFLYLPLVILGAAIGVFIMTNLFGENTTGAMTGIYALLIGYGLIVLIFNYVFFYMGNHMLALVKTRIIDFNTIALSHLYPVVKVLGLYTKVQPNSFQVMDTIREATRELKPDIGAEELAKFLYTTNLYLHYQKIGIRNTSILDALGIFDPNASLLRGVFAPADYLFRKSTYIEDYTDNILSIYKRMIKATAAASPIPDKVQNDASILVADWMADANNRANTFYPEDAIKPFLVMAILIFLVNTFPFLILAYIFRKQEVRDALFAVINKITAANAAAKGGPATPI